MRKLLLPALVLLAACDDIPKDAATPAFEKGESLARVAEAAQAAGNLDSAAELYRQQAAESDGDVSAHLALAAIYRKQKQPRMAVEMLGDARKLQPQDMKVLTQLGSAQIAAGEPRAALKTFDAALEASGGSVEARSGRGVALDALGRHSEAQEEYRTALERDAENAAVRNNLGLSLALGGEAEKAVAVLQPLVEEGRATPTMRQNLALAYGLKGDKARALELGMKDLPREKAEENLRFYAFYLARAKNAETVEKSAPVASVEGQEAVDVPVEEVAAVSEEEKPAEEELKPAAGTEEPVTAEDEELEKQPVDEDEEAARKEE